MNHLVYKKLEKLREFYQQLASVGHNVVREVSLRRTLEYIHSCRSLDFFQNLKFKLTYLFIKRVCFYVILVWFHLLNNFFFKICFQFHYMFQNMFADSFYQGMAKADWLHFDMEIVFWLTNPGISTVNLTMWWFVQPRPGLHVTFF